MAGTVNAAEFVGDKRKANLLWAMGYKRDGVTRVGGIAKPEEIKIGVGDVLFRFGNKARSEEDDRCGVWWMTVATLELNAQYASSVGGLIDTLRQNLALPAAFSPLDRVFGVSVRQRLSAFSGMGNGIFKDQLEPAQQSGMPPLLLGGMERDGSTRGRSLRFQLFIPGLKDCPGALEFGPVRSAMAWFNRPVGQRQWP